MNRVRAVYMSFAPIKQITLFISGYVMGETGFWTALAPLGLYIGLDFLESLLYWRVMDQMMDKEPKKDKIVRYSSLYTEESPNI